MLACFWLLISAMIPAIPQEQVAELIQITRFSWFLSVDLSPAHLTKIMSFQKKCLKKSIFQMLNLLNVQSDSLPPQKSAESSWFTTFSWLIPSSKLRLSLDPQALRYPYPDTPTFVQSGPAKLLICRMASQSSRLQGSTHRDFTSKHGGSRSENVGLARKTWI